MNIQFKYLAIISEGKTYIGYSQQVFFLLDTCLGLLVQKYIYSKANSVTHSVTYPLRENMTYD